MSRARILADYVSSGDELADKAPLAGPTFTGTVAIPNVANLETAVVANTAKVTNYNQTLADINALDITELGTVTSGVLEDAVTYRNINQDLASTDSPTFNNLSVSQIEGSTHYRSNFVSVFPYYTAHAVLVSNSTFITVCNIAGQWSTGNSHLEEWMQAPGAGFSESFYLTVVGGVGSGSAVLNFRLRQTGTTYDGIASTHVVQGWHGYASQFVKTVAIGTFNSVTLRNLLNTGSNNSVEVWINNSGASGYAGVSRVMLEQRIYFS